jgi:phosphate transport system permease protein
MESAGRVILFLSALVSVVAAAVIVIFLVGKGAPAIKEIGLSEFLFELEWKPGQGKYGILPMIVGSGIVTAFAGIIGIPLGLGTSLFMAEYCPDRLYGPLKNLTNLMASIPSIIFGFFGLVVIVPLIQVISGNSGKGILAASVLLGIMIIPTIVSLCEESIRSVPRSYYQGARALGATKEYSLIKVMLPAARMGIFTAFVLGVGRALGETMAVVMVCGNQSVLPTSIFSGVRTLTSNIVLEMGYATGLHRNALIATGVVLMAIILGVNGIFAWIKYKAGRNN